MMKKTWRTGLKHKQFSGLLIVLLLIVSCSSLPKDQEETPASEIKNLAATHAESGNSYYIKGNYEMALDFFTMSRNLNLSIDNRKGLAESYNSLGKLYLSWGKKGQAVENFSNARKIAEELTLPELSAQCLGHQGEMALIDGDVDGALTYFQEGMLLLTEKDHPLALAILYHNQAGAYKKQDLYEKAIESVMNAIRINEKESRFTELGANHYLLASLYTKQGNLELAVTEALKALENDKLVENSLGIGQDLFALGMISRRKNDETGAHDYFLRSFLVYESMGIVPKMKQTLKQLLEVSENQGWEDKIEIYQRAGEKLESME